MTARRARDGSRRGLGNYERWTPEQEAVLLRFRAAGTYPAEIARKMGLTLDRVRDKLKSLACRSGSVAGRAKSGDPLPTMLHRETPPWPVYEAPIRDNLKACDLKWGVK